MYQDWFPAIPELITATDETNILTTDLYDRPPTQPWSQQNITLLGDARPPNATDDGTGRLYRVGRYLCRCPHACKSNPFHALLSNNTSLCAFPA